MRTAKYTILITLMIAFGVFLLSDTVVFAQVRITPTCTGETCTFNDLYALGNNIIDFMLKLMVPLAAVGFAIAGFLIMFSGGDTGRVAKGRQIMWAVFFGMLLMLFAYAAIKTLLLVLTP